MVNNIAHAQELLKVIYIFKTIDLKYIYEKEF